MIPAPFDYDVAENADHALELLGAAGGDAKLLAGGHSLIPAMKLRMARPSKLIDIGRLSDLGYVKDAGTHIAIGALTRHAAVAADSLLAEHCPIVSFTAAQIGDPPVRHRGTLGGSVPSTTRAAASASDAPPARASSAAFARSGVPPMLTRPIEAPAIEPLSRCTSAATPTVAQS